MQKEDKEGSLQETSPEKKSVLKKVEDQQETTSKSTPEEDSSTVRLSQMIFYLLIEASLSYRYKFLPSEIEGYEKMVTEQITKQLGTSEHKNSRDLIFRSQQEILKQVKKYANRKNALTVMMQEELQALILGLDPTQVQRFKLDGHLITQFMEEFAKCKNLTHALGVVKAYNNGALDYLFKDINPNPDNNEKTQNDSNVVEQPAEKVNGEGTQTES